MPKPFKLLTCLAVALTCVGVALPALAQTATLTPEQMIEQLKPSRTRSLRNLTVEAAPGSASDKASGGAESIAAGQPMALAAQADPTLSARPSLTLLIQFDFDSAKVRAKSQQALANLSQALQSSDLVHSKFAVEGHTDAKGSANYNQKLSEARAQAVREFLTAQGVSPQRLLAAGKGASELANSASPLAHENRRVRIVNLD
jgi:outer membrane protein OmpA-like peptidoglycan-associated protein